MSKELDEIYANPCESCFMCEFKRTEPDCYKGNPAQCSVCAVIQRIIETAKHELTQAEQRVEQRGRIDELNRLRDNAGYGEYTASEYKGSIELRLNTLRNGGE